jgi:hypothetical protein
MEATLRVIVCEAILRLYWFKQEDFLKTGRHSLILRVQSRLPYQKAITTILKEYRTSESSRTRKVKCQPIVYCSETTGFLSTPIFSILTSTQSPGAR